jgi:hypothetical protein
VALFGAALGAAGLGSRHGSLHGIPLIRSASGGRGVELE